ncbi:Tyrosine-Protein Phosphatase Non-Receptor Type 5 [Manis pentadactyla]|nr:Tyrosine-Protein Phosphatase Non-Receptor Type 5 [Manis pentadactyla]
MALNEGPPVSLFTSAGLHKVHFAARRAGPSGKAGLGQSGSAGERREKRRPRFTTGTWVERRLQCQVLSLNPRHRGWTDSGPHARSHAARSERSLRGSQVRLTPAT